MMQGILAMNRIRAPKVRGLTDRETKTILRRLRRVGLIRLIDEISALCFREAEKYRRKWGDPKFALVWARRGELLHQIAHGLRKEEATLPAREPRPVRPKRKLRIPLLNWKGKHEQSD